MLGNKAAINIPRWRALAIASKNLIPGEAWLPGGCPFRPRKEVAKNEKSDVTHFDARPEVRVQAPGPGIRVRTSSFDRRNITAGEPALIRASTTGNCWS